MHADSATTIPGSEHGLGWLGIVRLGLVQTALGAIVVLTTSTMNRVMVVEYALPALLPGALVGLHYAIQMLRPRLGYGSDVGGRRTPWIVGGMGVLAAGGTLAALATAWMASHLWAGIGLAAIAFTLIGLGVGAAGTALLTLLAREVAPARRGAAATIVWMMMIVGFIITAACAGHFLDPFSPARLVAVAGTVAAIALALTVLAVAGVERSVARVEPARASVPFREALAEVWSDDRARRFTVFVFMSMLAFSAQDLILEPFAGTVFGYTPGQSTRLAGQQNAGVLCGMLLVALLAGRGVRGRRLGTLAGWTVGGCIASAFALAGLAIGGHAAEGWPLVLNVFLLGAGNGAFAVAAIGSMMALAGEGVRNREGTRMGLWGAAQAIAFGAGGFVGAVLSDVFRHASGSAAVGYTTVFALEAALFVVSAVLASRIGRTSAMAGRARGLPVSPEHYAAGLGGR